MIIREEVTQGEGDEEVSTASGGYGLVVDTN